MLDTIILILQIRILDDDRWHNTTTWAKKVKILLRIIL